MDNLPRHYNTDGTPHTKHGHIAPIMLIMPEDVGTLCLPEYHPGWYFCDEVEQINGPFEKFSLAVEAYNIYGESL